MASERREPPFRRWRTHSTALLVIGLPLLALAVALSTAAARTDGLRQLWMIDALALVGAFGIYALATTVLATLFTSRRQLVLLHTALPLVALLFAAAAFSPSVGSAIVHHFRAPHEADRARTAFRLTHWRLDWDEELATLEVEGLPSYRGSLQLEEVWFEWERDHRPSHPSPAPTRWTAMPGRVVSARLKLPHPSGAPPDRIRLVFRSPWGRIVYASETVEPTQRLDLDPVEVYFPLPPPARDGFEG